MTKSNVVKTKLGTTIKWGIEYKVREACGYKIDGQWFCVTHRKLFPNQMQKDSHISEPGTHEMAWLCDRHAFEVP
jgi:hypothetical protein